MAPTSDSTEADTMSFKDYSLKLHQSFLQMFRSQHLTDATLICEDRQIRVHKFLLSSSSSYFNKKFKKAKNADSLTIPNVKYGDLMNVLEYIYSGKVKIPSNEISSFIKTAGKLSIEIIHNELISTNADPIKHNGFDLGNVMKM